MPVQYVSGEQTPIDLIGDIKEEAYSIKPYWAFNMKNPTQTLMVRLGGFFTGDEGVA